MAFDARAVALRLTGGLGIRAFDDEVRERRAVRFGTALDAGMPEELFGLDRLEAILASASVAPEKVDIYQDGHLIRLPDLERKSGRTAVQIVIERFGNGATVRLRDLDTLDERVGALIAEVHRLFAASSQANLYLTPPGTSGFPPHFDITDVFIVQVAGAKQWRVFEDYTNRIELPAMDTNWDPDRFRPTTDPVEMTLSRGDVLYLPRGVMHQAVCTDSASMHLTVSLTPLTYGDLIERELRRVAAREVALRRRVPWSMDGDPDSRAGIEETVRRCLQLLERHFDAARVLEAERRAPRSNGDEPATGQLTTAVGALFRGVAGATPDAPSSRGQVRSQPAQL